MMIDQPERTKELLHELVELSFEPMIVWDFEKGILDWNHGCEKLYGFTRDEAVGSTVHGLLQTVHPASRQEFETRLSVQGEWSGELRHTTKEGRTVVVESRQRTAEIGGLRVVLETNRDVTERKSAKEKLREIDSRFRIMADAAPMLIWVNGVDRGNQFANRAYLDFFGKTASEVRDMFWQNYIHPDDEKRFIGSWLEAFQARSPFRCQARFLNTKAEYRWFDSIGTPRFSTSGEFLGYVGFCLDITESKRVQFHGQFVNQLDLELSKTNGADDIVRLTVASLGKYLGVKQCHVSEINRAANMAVVREGWETPVSGEPSVVGEYRISDFVTPEFAEALESGQAAIVTDAKTDPRTRDFASRYVSLGLSSFISIPMRDENRWEATLTVCDRSAHDWPPDQIQLVRDVAARLWSEVKRSRAVQALRESEARSRRTVAEQMVAGVAECNAAGKITMVNQRYCDITGRSAEQLLEMPVSEITHPDDWPRNAELFRQLFETGKSFFMEKRYRREDSTEVWVNTHVSPIRNAQGKVEEAVGVVIDVTDRKMAEQELAAAKDRLAADLDAMTRLQRIGATFVREGGLPAVFREIIETAVAITGADKGTLQLFDATSGKLTIVAHHGFEQQFLDFWSSAEDVMGSCGKALERGERYAVEDVTVDPVFMSTGALDVMLQAGVLAVQSTPVLARSGKSLAVFSTHYESRRLPNERSLRLLDLLASLTADIIEHAQAETALRSAYEQAEAATRAKDEFLAVVSHELRSPLTSILGYTQLLRKGTDAPQIKRMIQIIEDSSRMQLQLIEDLLDTARIISGKLSLEVQPLDLVNVINAALDVIRPAAQAKGIKLVSDLDPFAGQITGDPDRLQQIVWNLLSNAIKFTLRGGLVEITLKRNDPHVQIVVRDTGKGIEPAFLPHVFERFRQSDMSSARRAGGLGLGLALVKHLVELHGGTIEAQSEGVRQGATFTVRLPLRAVYTKPPEELRSLTPVLPTAVASLVGVHALIVDDEEDVRTLLTMTLQSCGATALAVPAGKEAIEVLARQTPDDRFDVLLCDIGMPDEDGYAVIRKVRAAPPDQGGSIPAIALTAYGRAENRVRALEAGFQMHVVKPVEPAELAVVILSLVKRFRNATAM